MRSKKFAPVCHTLTFILGGGIYVALETLFRGFSDVSMFYAGGLSLFLIGLLDDRAPKPKMIPKMLAGGMIITAVELVFGIVFNIVFGLGVWDYSGMFLNFRGQICPLFSFFWILLSFPAILISRGVRKLFEKLEKIR